MYCNIIDWKLVSRYQNFSKEQLKVYYDEIDWSIYCNRHDLSNDIVEQLANTHISQNIANHHEHLQPRINLNYKYVWEQVVLDIPPMRFTFEQYDDLCKHGKLDSLFTCYHDLVPFDLVMLYRDTIKKMFTYRCILEWYTLNDDHIMMLCNKFDNSVWKCLSGCRRIRLSNEFLKMYKDYVYWEDIIDNKKYIFDDDMLEYALSMLPKDYVNTEFFQKEVKSAISTHHNISKKFIMKYPELIDTKLLMRNPYVSKNLCTNI